MDSWNLKHLKLQQARLRLRYSVALTAFGQRLASLDIPDQDKSSGKEYSPVFVSTLRLSATEVFSLDELWFSP